MSELANKRCVPCEGGSKALTIAESHQLQKELDARWKLVQGDKRLEAHFEFNNYYRTTAFINAAAWISHQEDHHPDISFGYNKATVSYWTHTLDGLSHNDFICAAKIDALLK